MYRSLHALLVLLRGSLLFSSGSFSSFLGYSEGTREGPWCVSHERNSSDMFVYHTSCIYTHMYAHITSAYLSFLLLSFLLPPLSSVWWWLAGPGHVGLPLSFLLRGVAGKMQHFADELSPLYIKIQCQAITRNRQWIIQCSSPFSST